MTVKSKPTLRQHYRHMSQIVTRWGDNDTYGHVNNVVYYSYFDTAVNRHLIEQGALDLHASEIIGLVVESCCTFFSSLTFPDMVTVGIKVIRLGTSSVRYEIGLFRNEEDLAAAVGQFVHVYVDRVSSRSMPIPARTRAVLEPLLGSIDER